MIAPGLGRFIPRRSETLHRHTDNEAGTNCERTTAACTRRYVPTRLSLRNAYRQKIVRSNRDRKPSVENPGMVRTPSSSIPSHFRPYLVYRIGGHPPYGPPPATDPRNENQSCRAGPPELRSPKDKCVRFCYRQFHMLRDETALRSAASFPATWRRPLLRHGSRTPAIRAVAESLRTCSDTSRGFPRAAKKRDAAPVLFPSSARLLRSTSRDFRIRPLR